MGLHWFPWQEWREPGTFLLRHLPPRVRAVIPHPYSHHTCTKTALCSAGVQGLELLPEPTLACGMASCPSAAGHCRAGWVPSLLFLRSSACEGEKKRRVVHLASWPGCSPMAAQNRTDSDGPPCWGGPAEEVSPGTIQTSTASPFATLSFSLSFQTTAGQGAPDMPELQSALFEAILLAAG